MKKLSVIVLAAAAALPAAAHAQAYVQVQTGLDSVSVSGESEEGVAYGVAAGYDIPIGGSMFVGVEGSIDDSTTKECVSDLLVVGDETCVKTGRDLAAVVRLGTNLGESSQLYVLGGYTNARIRASYDDGTTKISDGENGDGFRLGAGFKQSFGQNFFGKVEYRYSNYESDFSRHNALVAVGVNF
ncbi:hypothetical protein MB02_14660 [Croceicoccus estronivorus]|uniref:outer membrane protein n=1 Tax=Croceicoccus estronivorus TaxID=1172626 RepID=UPI00082D705A|nr:porin family protein [Croceicoccus estronivorus]OCC22997.1 hypothetical protein MB02_14660 [Croceicoccus estronivorus]